VKASDGTERIRITSSGQALAREAVVQRYDLSARGHWIGGFVQPPPDPHQLVPCAGRGILSPKQSDIVVTGASESDYLIRGLVDVDSEAQIVETPSMARLGWERWAQPAFVRCLRTSIASPGTIIASVERLSFPRLGSFAAAYRAIYGPQDAGPYEQVEDTILIASDCARLRLDVGSVMTAEAATTRLEHELARFLVRATAGTCPGVA
jgi:hypothetical protein